MQPCDHTIAMDEAAATESPLWNPAPPSPANREVEHSPILSVRQQLQDELEKCSTQDSVGETMYSRSWLLSLLVKAVDYVQSKKGQTDDTLDDFPSPHSEPNTADGTRTLEVDSQERTTDPPSGTVEEQAGDETHGGSNSGGGVVLSQPRADDRHPCELDESMENDMCKLWDTSVNEEVARFLIDNQSVSLLLGVAYRSTAPRLTEICLGIVGNLACHEPLCQESLLAENNIHRIFEFLQDGDTQVVYESLRLMQTCLGHPTVRGPWVDCIIGREQTVRLGLQFILQSSTVVDLLTQAGSLIDILFTSSEELAKLWSTQEFLQSLVEAVNQLRLSNSDLQCVGPFMFVMDVISSSEAGAAMLIGMHSDVEDILTWFIVEGSSEVVVEGGGTSEHLTMLAACSVLLFLHQTATGEGDSVQDTSSELLPALERMQQAMSEETEGDTCFPHEGGEGEGGEEVEGEEGEGGEGSSESAGTSSMKQLRTVVNSLLELLQPLESSTNISVEM